MKATTVQMIGKRFGRLVVTAEAEPNRLASGRSKRRVIAHCDCGKDVTATADNLRSGHTRSCGCFHLDSAKTAKHGDTRGYTKTAEYRVWSQMIERCTNPNAENYARYGGRGIKVFARWRTSYADFLADMGRRPSAKHSIDRIDNDGNYRPGNCHWATGVEQAANKRRRSVAGAPAKAIR
jgi:hypothetical protein